MSDALEIATLPARYHWPVSAEELPYPIGFPPAPDPPWREDCARIVGFNTLGEGWHLFEDAFFRSLEEGLATNVSPWLWVLDGKHAGRITAALCAEPRGAAVAAMDEYRRRAFGWGWDMTSAAMGEIRGAIVDYLKLTQPSEIVVIRLYEWGKY